eukprot:CAMPEP_0177711450 /NCGR_PEP_ID=MMETSP0484_2-20121128/11867_1 /TAXON_ID=354590 /ORGANISM="Rhodomonas lens, Strain RHODO" /LENGTH=60 /DNA_ID=CAMNT_0019223183 /DNA_START=259 /DNA_END=441 /DNA_ORIENTATION=+
MSLRPNSALTSAGSFCSSKSTASLYAPFVEYKPCAISWKRVFPSPSPPAASSSSPLVPMT